MLADLQQLQDYNVDCVSIHFLTEYLYLYVSSSYMQLCKTLSLRNSVNILNCISQSHRIELGKKSGNEELKKNSMEETFGHLDVLAHKKMQQLLQGIPEVLQYFFKDLAFLNTKNIQ